MVGLVEARAFEDYACRKENAANFSTTLRASGERIVNHFLPCLEPMPTRFTEIFIGWHITNHPLFRIIEIPI